MPDKPYRSWQIKHNPAKLSEVHYVVWQAGRPIGELHPAPGGWSFDNGATVYADFRDAIVALPGP